MTSQLAPVSPSEVAIVGQPAFDSLVNFTLQTVSPASQRVYTQTYQQWAAWCETAGIDALDLTPTNILDYLRSLPVTKRTRQRQLSSLRKLVRVLALDYSNPRYRALYEALLLIKVPEENIGGSERERRALTAQDVWKVLDVWNGDSPIHRRNRALLSVAFYTGCRRQEIRDLRWTDIDFAAGVIYVRHGKGDKPRDVAVVEDDQNTAIKALRNWQEVAGTDREFVFCAIAKSGKLGADKPMNVRAVNQLVDRTSAKAGIEFTMHDSRRTLGTDLLAQGYSTADVQAQLGHAHASTTIQGYAMPADAHKRRARFKTSY